MIEHSQRPGFSLVEVVIAMLILSVGALAMGASTAFVMNQLQASQLRSERMGAVRQAAEILGGTDWSTLESTCTDETLTTDNYTVQCSVSQSGNVKRVRLITVGPAFRSGAFVPNAADTVAISLAQPVQ